MTGLLSATALFAVAVPAAAGAQKVDTVTLINGDRITGEIMGVSRGKLSYDTDDVGLLSIEWLKVIRLVSNRTFLITDRSGRRHIGSLRRSTYDGFLAIGDDPRDTLRMADAVTMTELGARFVRRLNGAVDVGVTRTNANNAATLSVDAEVEYRARDIGVGINYQNYQQTQQNAPGVLRWAAMARGSRYLKKDQWSLESVIAAQKNNELDLERRVFGGGGMGLVLRRSNHDDIQLIAGIVVNKERFSVDSAAAVTGTNGEGVLRMKAAYFRFDKPKLTATTDVWAFTMLSSTRRVRGDARLDVKYTGMQDFSIGVNVQDFFDSRPPSTAARKNDVEITFTLGWKYRR